MIAIGVPIRRNRHCLVVAQYGRKSGVRTVQETVNNPVINELIATAYRCRSDAVKQHAANSPVYGVVVTIGMPVQRTVGIGNKPFE